MEADMSALHRRDGWEVRLAEVIEAARHAPYVLGQTDCLRLACAAVEALTGTDFWPRFAGYKTKRQALLTIAKIAPSLGEAVTTTLGVPPTPTLAAQRGDIALFRDATGEDHLGVVVGSHVMLTAPWGIEFARIDHGGVLLTWRIG
jgi:cell wall-associated NlpC family hydrolase